ncbi:MAG: hypothetical protein ABIA21_02150 [Candidatus Aenigmatarchaeota archaeon]
MRDIFERVRLGLKCDILDTNGRIREPFIYTAQSDDENVASCYNSGGRSVILPYNSGAIKINGVDPAGILTREVAASQKNKIEDVVRWSENAKDGTLPNDRPLGVYTLTAAKRAEMAYEKLNSAYRDVGLRPPCSYIKAVPMDKRFGDEELCQIRYELPVVEDDLRVLEFSMLLKERLDEMTPHEIEELEKPIMKLYHRICLWHGLGIRIMIDQGILPLAESFEPQNYVISEQGGGYGIFRVDHTSTEIVNMHRDDLLDELLKRVQKHQTNGFLAPFARIPTAVTIAAHYSDQVPPDTSPLFERCYHFMSSVCDSLGLYAHYLNALNTSFSIGLSGAGELIEKKWFRQLLE